jgi:phenylacetate-CoA ligase
MGYDPVHDLAVEIGLVGGEILSEALRGALNDRGIIVRQSYITAELGAIAYECPEQAGMHLSDDLLVEICDPISGEPLPAGSVGEVVVTPFSNDCYPLIRYGTGDLSRLEAAPCPCGRTSLQLAGILGRTDEVTKVKGMFVHPRQIDEAVARFGDVIEKVRVVVTRAGSLDVMTLEVQPKAGAVPGDALRTGLVERIREVTKLRAEVVFVDEIPAEGKKIEDRRTWE